MGEQEKIGAINAWIKHVERSQKTKKFSSFSSIAEEEFCDNFKRGVLAQAKLTNSEKIEIIAKMRP